MGTSLETLREAVSQGFSLTTPWKVLSKRHGIPVMSIRRAYASMKTQDAQPQCAADIIVTIHNCGTPTKLSFVDEQTISEAVLYYAKSNRSLSRNGLRDLVQEYVSTLTLERQDEINFCENKPSKEWFTNFLERNFLQFHYVQMIEDKRVKAFTPENLTKHITRVSAAIKKFNIKDTAHTFNTDQSGALFKKMKGRSLKKGIGSKGMRLAQKALTTKGRIDRVTIMPVVSADGKTCKPDVIFPGKLAHYRQRNPPGADSQIFFEWAKGFVQETLSLRINGQRLLLVLDGYGDQIQYRTLKYFKDHNVIVLALPAHTSHVTKPPDVTVFNSYKSFLQEELHRAARQKNKLIAFDVAQCIYDAYSRSHTAPNIRSGFQKAKLFDPAVMGTNFEPLRLYMKQGLSRKADVVSVNDILEKFSKQGRTLLCDSCIDEAGHVRVDTTAGSHVTGKSVLVALYSRKESQSNGKRKRTRSCVVPCNAGYKEPIADIRRLIQSTTARAAKRQRLTETRRQLREARKQRLALSRAPFEEIMVGTS